MTDLLFRRPLSVGHPADLVFGRPIGPVQDAAGRLEIVLPPFTARFDGVLDYDLAVSGSDVIGIASSWQPAAAVIAPTLHARHATGQQTRIAPGVPWGSGRRVVGDLRSAWQQLDSILTQRHPGWQAGEPLHRTASSAWQAGTPSPHASRNLWQAGSPAHIGAAGGWSVAAILPARPRGLRWGAARPTPVSVRASAQSGAPVWQRPMRIRWTSTEPLPAGRSIAAVPPVQPPWRCYTPPGGGAVHLLFDERQAGGGDILFSCGAGGSAGAVIVPTLRAYIVVNSATLTRVSNNLQLPLRDISISGDADSVHWAWSATLPLRSLADLEPDMPGQLVELEARLNDMPWRLLVEKRTESERFGSGSLRISGRGVAAELSAPGAASTPRNNLLSAQTAQQLAADALTINGVSSGWTLTWQGADWLLPAGLWAHTGTPMEAVLRLAEAGGAYVLPAPAARSLAVLPRYPAAPWEWASLAPGVVLPAAATLERGSEEIVRPGSNIVFVCGRNLNARVRRTGSAGDRPAQMIVDPLTAHADAARQRGLAALAEASSHRMWQLETGILPGYGVIQIGTVLDWVRGETTRRGIVRGLAVAASLPSGASKDPVKVRQTLGVEIHG